MSLRHKIQECTSISDIDRALSGRRVRPSFRKILETAVLLSNHPDKMQREYGAQFMQTALQEADLLDKAEKPASPESDGIEKDDVIKEELLAGGNQDGTGGSEQSTDNTEPYPQVAKDTDEGEKPMDKASGEDQMKEGFPPASGPPMPGMMPGMEPGVAAEMGGHMPQLPPMNTNQMMRQMQYTLNETLKRYVLPLRQQIKVQQEAIKKLSSQIREVQIGKGAMKLDIAHVRENATARTLNPIHETVTNLPEQFQRPFVHSKVQETESAKMDIVELDKLFRNQ